MAGGCLLPAASPSLQPAACLPGVLPVAPPAALPPPQGMSLVPAVTELVLAEMLYLQYDNPTRPIFMYINSTGVNVGARARGGLRGRV